MLEAEVATFEAGREAPALSDQLSEDLSSQIEAAVRTGTPHLKSLLAFMPGVRVVFGQRRRTEHNANSFPGSPVRFRRRSGSSGRVE